MTYCDYDHVKFIYQTPIRRYEQNALAKAVEQAVKRAIVSTGPSDIGHAFRVVDASYSTVIDADGDVYGTTTQLEIIAFPIIKATATGIRILRGGSKLQPETRWISDSWNKQWANRTPEGALRDYIARKNKQARIYEARAKTARAMAYEAESVLRERPPSVLDLTLEQAV